MNVLKSQVISSVNIDGLTEFYNKGKVVFPLTS